MTRRRAHLLSWLALGIGGLLLAATLWLLDFHVVRAEARHLAAALPLVLVVSGVAQLARTIAWAACFPSRAALPFWHLARVRLAAEAFSYLTLRGIAGEPLKVLLLDRRVDPREATAAVALERIAYMAFTTVLVGIAAVVILIVIPLSEVWFRVFRAFAIVAAAVVVLSMLVVSGRGRYLGWLETRWGRIGRFIAAVERQFLELVRGNPRRLAIILAMDVLTYAAMAAEVWVVLWAVGANPTVEGSVAIETFSRVASFASSFIPANLGALEVSSVAAVAAIGATSGGAALALARRIRGIFWAAAGLAIYPRPRRQDRERAAGATLLYVAPPVASDVSVFGRVAGLPIAERVFRAARRHGCGRVAIATTPARQQALARLAVRAGLEVTADAGDPAFRVEYGWIPRPGNVALEMLPTRVASDDDLRTAEREIRAAVFKPTDHNLARFNRRISLPISIALLRTPITANQFSIGLLVLGLYSAWLFMRGTYWTGVAAAAVSLAASILDGCDGEIARLKHQESAFGCWLETVTDYTYYFAIFGGMTVGAVRYTSWTGYYWIGAGALAGMVLAFLALLYLRHQMTRATPEKFGGTIKGRFKQGGAGWTKVLAKLSNVATRAQMPYGILTLALIGALPLVVILCLIGANLYWIGIVARFRSLFVPAGFPVREPTG
jgi:phosphatidylglycerophosphate synthase